ncbi:MAG TPA: DNA topoisomerase IB [Devosiaceae bacterium]|jgi:DNA topoisomerase-1|nr:DNA topoisomerase IB [Devosiaceae bacterium]
MTRLKRVRRDDLKVARRRSGRGYSYVDAEGNRFNDPEFLQRVRALGIPPAWKDVRIALNPRAHIQAFGADAEGRVQYIYHPEWERRRIERRQRQLGLLAESLPRLRRRVTADLALEAGSRELALAIGVALIDRTAMRVGRERYLVAHGTRGAGTLYSRDVVVNGDSVAIEFPAKSGKHASYAFKDARLADAIRRIKTIRGRRLLMHLDDEGKPRAIRTEELNAYIREISGAHVTAKDFRTLHASALAAEALAGLQREDSASARKRQITRVTKQVASFLQNTPMICRRSYIAPCLFALFDDGKLDEIWTCVASRKEGMRQREVRLAVVLQSAAGISASRA